MNSKIISLLLFSGCLAGVVFFVGDILFRGDWGSGRSFGPDRVYNVMASVAVWRLYLGSFAGPVGIWLEILGMLGLWYCCRGAAPGMAAVMLVSLITFDIFGISPHGQYGPIGFALRYCGSDGDAVRHIERLNSIMTAVATAFLVGGFASWIFLTLRKQTGVPSWTVVFCPIFTMWLEYALVYVPAPIGFPLVVGWKSLSFAIFFSVVALTYDGHESES